MHIMRRRSLLLAISRRIFLSCSGGAPDPDADPPARPPCDDEWTLLGGETRLRLCELLQTQTQSPFIYYPQCLPSLQQGLVVECASLLHQNHTLIITRTTDTRNPFSINNFIAPFHTSCSIQLGSTYHYQLTQQAYAYTSVSGPGVWCYNMSLEYSTRLLPRRERKGHSKTRRTGSGIGYQHAQPNTIDNTLRGSGCACRCNESTHFHL